MHIVGAVILGLVALYFLFMAVDGAGLATQTAEAEVVGKEHRPPGRTYTRQVINKQTYTVPQDTPEMFVLALDMDGQRAEGVTDRALYERVESGDRVQVSYQRRRLTGAISVVSVSR